MCEEKAYLQIVNFRKYNKEVVSLIVSAEYFKFSEKVSYRRKTLLHLGNSPELIGSAVLINPGSASPTGVADLGPIQSFYSQNHNDEHIDFKVWKSFKADSTMIQLIKIFNGWYTGRQRRLNGIIQLFNCFYLKQQHLDKAIEGFIDCSNWIFTEHHLFKDKPVYFGWGNTGKNNKEIREVAWNIFDSYDKSKTPIYKNCFDENCFYHPGYLNRSYNRNPKSIEMLASFSKLVEYGSKKQS